MTELDLEGAEIERLMWEPTSHLRMYRPAGCSDTEMLLQQLWERVTGEHAWRDVPVVLED